MLCLSHVAATIAAKYRAQIRDGWQEPTNIYTVTALPPGERKSAVYAAVMNPAYKFEQQLQAEMVPIIASMQTERKLLEDRVKYLCTSHARQKDANQRNKDKQDAKEAARELAAFKVPATPQIIADDCLTEKMGSLLAEQGGRMLLSAPEGTCFEIAKGRYSETPNFDVFLKGHAGDPLRCDRISRGHEAVDRPALTIAVAVQPDVIRGLAEEATMLARGFLARFLFSIPKSYVGSRKVAPAAVAPSLAQTFATNILSLWKLPACCDERGEYTPTILEFSPSGDAVMRDLERWLEPQLGEDAPLAHLGGWAGKLAGAIARLAAILHAASCIGSSTTISPAIDGDTVDAAVRIGRDYLLPHALSAFGLMGADPRMVLAKRALCRLHDFVDSVEFVSKGVISKRDIHVHIMGTHFSVDQVDAVVEVLINYGCLRRYIEPAKHGPGRKPGPHYEVHPSLIEKRL
jgi:hypothetical protein